MTSSPLAWEGSVNPKVHFLSHHVLLICIRLLVKIHDRIFRFSYDLPFIITGKDL